MPFFSRFHTPTAAFPSDVFRLLDELNQVNSPATPSQGGNKRAFSPNFDVHETETQYILEGELPGLEDKSKLNIEFTDDKTLLVRGKIERSSTRSSDPHHSADGKSEEKHANGDGSHKDSSQVAKRPEDGQKAVGKPNEVYRYWVSERTVGEFQRSFSFPGAIDIENVKASLEHGLLRIVVPKQKEEVKGRKIAIS